MYRLLRAALCVPALIAALLTGLTGAAQATSRPAAQPAAPPAAQAQAQAQAQATRLALTCAAGDLCVWPVADGSRNRCSWTNSDTDWWNAPITCSWSRNNAVQAVYNNGRNTAYTGVCLYEDGYSGDDWTLWVRQASQAPGYGYIYRSHRWCSPAGTLTATGQNVIRHHPRG